MGLCLAGLLTMLASTGAKAGPAEKSRIIEPDAPVEAVVGAMAFRTCTIPYQGRERTVQCAWLSVPENPESETPETSTDETLDLFVVRLPAKRQVNDIHDPVLFVAGGPGQAASETFLFADHVWSSLAKNRDFYLIDQRGTGYSNFMGCGDVLKSHKTVPEKYNSEQIRKQAKACVDALPGDPRFYTTESTVRDFERARDALGIAQWNLLGVSYGTRVVTHYMRRFPQSIRTVVLDSVVPPQHVLGEELAIRSQESLNTLLQRCENDPDCHSRFPTLAADVQSLFERLEAAPVELPVENIDTGAIETQTFRREDLAMLVRLNLYHPGTAAMLPPMLHQAATNQHFSPLIRAASNIAQHLHSTMSYGLHHSVMCTEEYPHYDLTPAERRANEDSYLGMSVLRFIKDVCSVWPKGEAPASMKTPLVSDIPALLLSGEYDPITPPDYAEQALEHLSNGRHLVLKGQGHFVSGTGCAPHLVDHFVNDKSAEALDTACLRRLSAAPLYLNFNGTAP